MKKIVLLLVLSVGLVACGRSSDEYDQWQDSSGILRFIPADSPLVAVRLAPFPDVFRQRFAVQNALIADANRKALRSMSDAREAADGSDAAADAFFDALQRFNRLSTGDGVAEAGVASGAPTAVYFVGARPVFRVALEDEVAFEQFVAGISSEFESAAATLEGQRYRDLRLGGVRFALLIHEGWAVLTPAPDATGDAALAAQLGLTLPTPTIAESGLLARLAEKHELTGAQLAYLEPAGLFDIFTAPGGLLSELAAAGDPRMEIPPNALSPECLADIRRWYSSVDAITVGYSEAGASGLKGAMAIDIAPAIAKDLVDLAQPVPGLGVPTDALLSFGISLDVEQLRTFVENRLASVLEEPFKCAGLADLNRQAERLSTFLTKQPTPPTAKDFRGFSVFIHRPPGTQSLSAEALRNARVSWLLSTDEPESLVALGNLFVPQIAALNLQPDGAIVDVPKGLLNPTGQDMKLAMLDDRLIGSLGPDGEAQITELKVLSADPKAPVFALDVGPGAYLELTRDLTTSFGLGDAALAEELMRLYSRQSVRLRTTRNGVRLDFEMTLKENGK